MQQTTIMIVGTAELCSSLTDAVGDETGLRVAAFTGAAAARAYLETGKADTVLAIVDVELPDGEAFTLCAGLTKDAGVPVMTVGPPGEDGADAVRSLEAGAIDHFARPANRAELLARLRAHLRSLATSLEVDITIGPFVFRPGQRALFDRQTQARIWLTAKETRLLRRLHLANGQSVPAEALIEAAWNSATTSVHTLHTHVYRLRSKLGTAGDGSPLLRTTRDGYALIAP